MTVTSTIPSAPAPAARSALPAGDTWWGPTDLAPAESAAEVAAERSMVRGMLVDALLAIPAGAALFVAIGAIALAGGGHAVAPVLWALACVGVLAGVFFGLWAGVVRYAGRLDDLDADG